MWSPKAPPGCVLERLGSVRGASEKPPACGVFMYIFYKTKAFLFWNKKHEDHKLNNDFGNMRPTDGPPWPKWAQKAFPGCVRERLGSLAGAAYLWYLLQLNKSQVFFEIFECRNYYKWPHNCSGQEASPESEKWAYLYIVFTQTENHTFFVICWFSLFVLMHAYCDPKLGVPGRDHDRPTHI